jgi:hypothetical protein
MVNLASKSGRVFRDSEQNSKEQKKAREPSLAFS